MALGSNRDTWNGNVGFPAQKPTLDRGLQKTGLHSCFESLLSS